MAGVIIHYIIGTGTLIKEVTIHNYARKGEQVGTQPLGNPPLSRAKHFVKLLFKILVGVSHFMQNRVLSKIDLKGKSPLFGRPV